MRIEHIFLFVEGESKWFAFCQVRFKLSLCYSNEDVGQAVGNMNLELREG